MNIVQRFKKGLKKSSTYLTTNIINSLKSSKISEATIDEIESHGWSLNPGRYVGIAEGKEDDFDFKERLGELKEELEILNAGSERLEKIISGNINLVLMDSNESP